MEIKVFRVLLGCRDLRVYREELVRMVPREFREFRESKEQMVYRGPEV